MTSDADNETRTEAIILSVSSDIGDALARRWMASGWQVAGTYRTESVSVMALAEKGCRLVKCDVNDAASVEDACQRLLEESTRWDVLVSCPASQEPIGRFADSCFSDWEKSIRTNLTGQLQAIHELLPRRNIAGSPTVLCFSGGGTNNAPVCYSAYIISKIGLMKMCELLAAEIPDTKFVILGPGWVKTKIHDSTLCAGEKAGSNYQRTLEKLRSDECTPMDTVMDCCDWVVQTSAELVSGRNFSVVHDAWGTRELEDLLRKGPDIYKLRRYGNDIRIVGGDQAE